MLSSQRKIFLIRHGETAWTISGQHTGNTDIPLTKNGMKQARLIGKRLQHHSFASVFTSPLQRAKHTCELTGLLKSGIIDPDLSEWNYGEYEGLTSEQIWEKQPDWTIFTNGAPHGESVLEVAKRAQKVLDKIQSIDGDVILFSHGHFLRVLAASWLHFAPQSGSRLALFPGSISILGFQRGTQVIELWNDTSHV